MIQRLSSLTKFNTNNTAETEAGRKEKQEEEEEEKKKYLYVLKKKFVGVRSCSYGVTEPALPDICELLKATSGSTCCPH